jgi:hypothetical protein
VEVGDDGWEAGGEGGEIGECQDCTEWNDSMLDEKSDSDSATVEPRKGDFVLCLDGGLITSESIGGAVIDLLQVFIAWGRDSESALKVMFRNAGWMWLRGVLASLKLSSSTTPAEATKTGWLIVEFSTDGFKIVAEAVSSGNVFTAEFSLVLGSSFLASLL